MAREAMQLPQTPAAHAATHGYRAVIRMLLERLMYGVAEPAAVPFGRVRQVYGDAKELVLLAPGALRGSVMEKLLWLLAAFALLVVGAAMQGLVILWAMGVVCGLMVELAGAVLWRCVQCLLVQLLA